MKTTTNFALIPKIVHVMPIMQQARNRFSKQFISRLGLALTLLAIASCSNVTEYGMNAIGVNVTAINELKSQKSDDNAPVYVSGKVERKVPLLERQIYEIEDSTGKILLLTDQKGWKIGDKVVVKAIPQYESILISGAEGAEFGQVYLEEK